MSATIEGTEATEGTGDRVRTWPWVSLNLRREHLDEWTALARDLGRSRADLLRETLEQCGLPYARALARQRSRLGVTNTTGGRR